MTQPEPNIFEVEYRTDGWYVLLNGKYIAGPYFDHAGVLGALARAEREHERAA